MATFEKDGFVIDLNKMSRRDYIAWRKGRENLDDKDTYDAQYLLEKVIVKWPYDGKPSVDTYLDLGFAESIRVDAIVGEAVQALMEKK